MFTVVDDDGPSVFVPRNHIGKQVALAFVGAVWGIAIAAVGIWMWGQSEESRPTTLAKAPAKVPAEDPAPGTIVFDADEVGRWSMTLGLWIAGGVLPLVVPAILSRRGYLSVSRWAMMAAFCACVALFGGIILGISYESKMMGRFVAAKNLDAIGAALAIPSLFGIAGCILAGAIHPKGRP